MQRVYRQMVMPMNNVGGHFDGILVTCVERLVSVLGDAASSMPQWPP